MRPESGGLPATPHGKGGGHGQRNATEPGKALEGTVRNAERTNIAKAPLCEATTRGSDSAVTIKSAQVAERPEAGTRRALRGAAGPKWPLLGGSDALGASTGRPRAERDCDNSDVRGRTGRIASVRLVPPGGDPPDVGGRSGDEAQGASNQAERDDADSDIR